MKHVTSFGMWAAIACLGIFSTEVSGGGLAWLCVGGFMVMFAERVNE